MTEEMCEDLVTQVRRVVKAKKTFYFWMVPKGSDGDPILIVEKKKGILKKRARAERKKARVKVPAEGEMFPNPEGELLFVNEGKLDGGKVEKIFKTKLATHKGLKKIAGYLRKAKVLTPEELEQLEKDQGTVHPTESEDAHAHKDDEYEDKLDLCRELLDKVADDLGQHHSVADTIRKGIARAEEYKGNRMPAAALQALDVILGRRRQEYRTAMALAWNVEAKRVGDLYRQAMEKLDTDLDNAAEDPKEKERLQEQKKSLETLRAKVNETKSNTDSEGDPDLSESLDTFEILEAECEEVLDTLSESERKEQEKELDKLDEELDDEDEVSIAEDLDSLRQRVEELLLTADADLERAGSPQEAASILQEAWALYRHEDYEAAEALVADEFRPKLEAASVISLRALSFEWLELENQYERSRGEVRRYVETVEKDPISERTDVQELISQLEGLASDVLPVELPDMSDLIDEAVNDPGKRAGAMARIRAQAGKLRAEIEMAREIAGSFEDSAFGKFNVHAPLVDTLDKIEKSLRVV